MNAFITLKISIQIRHYNNKINQHIKNNDRSDLSE